MIDRNSNITGYMVRYSTCGCSTVDVSCLELARVVEPTLQHCWHLMLATPFRWQQLPALEPLDPSVPLSLRKCCLLKVKYHSSTKCLNNASPTVGSHHISSLKLVCVCEGVV